MHSSEVARARLRMIDRMIDRALDARNQRLFHLYVLRRRELLLQWGRDADEYDEEPCEE